MSGKGDKPRNCFGQRFKDNYDAIDWRVKKSSEEWHEEICAGVVIMDHDGWNRNDFKNSWNEKITREEFVHRLALSTCSYPPDFFKIN